MPLKSPNATAIVLNRAGTLKAIRQRPPESRRPAHTKRARAKNKCGPGQPPEPHRTWIFHLAFSTAGAVGSAQGPTAPPKGVPLLPEPAAGHDFHHRSASSAVASGLILLKEQDKEEAAMPGQPARAHTHSGMSPAIHPRELPACH